MSYVITVVLNINGTALQILSHVYFLSASPNAKMDALARTTAAAVPRSVHFSLSMNSGGCTYKTHKECHKIRREEGHRIECANQVV